MTTLYLNGKRAVVDEGQALKLVRENTYFTKSGTYTYNISLPICPENIAIFGMLLWQTQIKFGMQTLSCVNTHLQTTRH